MSYTNYSDLQASVADYCGRDDLTTEIQDFIRFAEIRLARELRTRQMLDSATAPTIANDARVASPTDFLEIRDMFIQGNPRRPLTYMSPSAFTREAKATHVGLPVFYTILAQEFQFAPIPDAVYTLQILYYARPKFLSNANVSNVFLANYPDALVYAALIEAEPYLINDARSQTWATLYDRAIRNISDSDQGGEYSGIPLQMKIT